jgi:hypothetical protein
MNAVYKSTRREDTPEKIDYRIKVYMAFLPRHLVNYTIKKLKSKERRIQGCQAILERTVSPDTTSMEKIIEECGDLPPKVKDLLLRVAYKRRDERLHMIMSQKNLRLWWTKIRPALKEWAKNSGLTDG